MNLKEFLAEWNNNSDQVLVHTSGSTGKPKPMWVEKQRMLNSARITCDCLGLQEGDTALLCMNLDYIGAKMMAVRAIERKLHLTEVEPSGHPLHSFVSGRSPLPFEGKEGFTFIAMVPMQVYNSLQVPEEAALLRKTKHLIIGGGAIDDKLARQLKDFPNYVWSTYGMTETLSHIALRRLNGPEASEWYTPFASVEISKNAEGCLVINAPAVHDGELITNDIVELKQVTSPLFQEGSGEIFLFRILGRKDNVIVSGGIKIQIEEVEKSLKPFMPSPFMITKKPSEKFGESVVLLTEMKDMAEASEICMNALPKYWVPKHIIHVDQLPLTETGKPARKEAENIVLQHFK